MDAETPYTIQHLETLPGNWRNQAKLLSRFNLIKELKEDTVELRQGKTKRGQRVQVHTVRQRRYLVPLGPSLLRFLYGFAPPFISGSVWHFAERKINVELLREVRR